MSLQFLKQWFRTKEPGCHSVDKAGFKHPLREDFFIPFSDYIFECPSSSCFACWCGAVEFNELWATAQKLSSKINEWRRRAAGVRRGVSRLARRCLRVRPDAHTGWAPTASLLSSTARRSLINEVPRLPAIVLFILSPGDLWLRKWQIIFASEPWSKLVPSDVSAPWASGGSTSHRQLISVPGLPFWRC